jgi:type VI secretion system secreted protein VgrG
MAELRIPAECIIKIENKELRYSIYGFELNQSIDAHHWMKAELRPLVDKSPSDSEFIDADEFTPFLGKPVTVTIKPKGGLVDPGLALRFTGIVTETQVQNYLGETNQIVLIAQSPSYLLDTAAKNRFFGEKSLSDISNMVLSSYSLDRGNMNIPPIKYKFCIQYGETDYRFLKRLAEQEGLWAYYDGTKFSISSSSSDETVALTWRDTLGSFALNLSCQQQFFQHKVYNYEEKKTYLQDTEAVSTRSNPSGFFKIPLDASETVLPEEGILDFPRRVEDAKQLDGYLSVKKSESRAKLVLGWGESTVPLLSVGKKAEIKNMVKELNGQYLITQVIHHYDHSGNYYNQFQCIPVDLAYPQKTAPRPLIEGLHSAVVTANDDPDHLGRVKVRFQWNRESEETPWIRVVTAHAGKDRGAFCLPELGDEVLVSFDQDYPESPMVIGSLYNKVEAPVGEAKNSKNDIKTFITKGKNRVVIKDTEGQEEILVTTKEEKNKISMKMSSPPEVSIYSEGKISLDADEIILRAKKKLTCTSEGPAELTAKDDLKMKGMNAELTAQTNVKVEGAATVKVDGATTEVNGKATVQVKAPIVRIN